MQSTRWHERSTSTLPSSRGARRRRYPSAMARTVADRVESPRHAGALEGAHGVGEAHGGERLLVRIGLWREGERLVRARFRATTCASLIAFADAACEALEAGAPPGRLDAAAVGALVAGVHPVHHDIARRSSPRESARPRALSPRVPSPPHPPTRQEPARERRLRLLHPERLLHPREDDRSPARGGPPRREGGRDVLLRGQQLPVGAREPHGRAAREGGASERDAAHGLRPVLLPAGDRGQADRGDPDWLLPAICTRRSPARRSTRSSPCSGATRPRW